MLCTLCARLDFLFWDELHPVDQKIARKHRLHLLVPGSKTEACRYFVHQRSISTLKETAEIGCHFCVLLWHSLFNLPPHGSDFADSYIDWQNYQNQALVFRLELYGEGPWVEQLDSKSCDGNIWVCCADMKPIFLRLKSSLSDAVAELSDALAGSWSLSSSYTEDDSTGSWASMSLVKHWYETCVKEHRLCAPKMRTMPTRVIDLGETRSINDLLLHKPPGEQTEAYVAVSHQWGDEKTREQFDLRATENSELPHFSHWPQVFQDAFLVTKSLGIRYIWIDNVCIDQNDADDWNRESGKMAAYYGNAALVIAASKAKDWTKGCFSKRNPLLVRPCRITFSHTNPAARSAPCVWVENRDLNDNGVKENPLHSRAWVLQEELLPRRVIRYGLSQVFWECLERERDEKRPEFGTHIGRRRFADPENLREVIHLPIASPNMRNKHYDAWYAIVEELTVRNMTYQKDTLPAISGLATVMASRMSKTDVYLAGLWSGDLATGLLWVSGFDNRKLTLSPERKNFDREEFTSPSWSWVTASHHRVFFNFEVDLKPGNGPGKQLLCWVASELDQSSCPTKIISFDVETKNQDSPYGQVLFGRIRFRTKLGRLTMLFAEPGLEPDDKSHRSKYEVPFGHNRYLRTVTMDSEPFDIFDVHGKPFSGFCILDSLAELRLGELPVWGSVEAWFLPLLGYRAENLGSPEMQVMGLALAQCRTGKSTEYERIGRASIGMEFDDDWRLSRLPVKEIDVI